MSVCRLEHEDGDAAAARRPAGAAVLNGALGVMLALSWAVAAAVAWGMPTSPVLLEVEWVLAAVAVVEVPPVLEPLWCAVSVARLPTDDVNSPTVLDSKMVDSPDEVKVEPPLVTTVAKLEVEMAEPELPPTPTPTPPPPTMLKMVEEPTVDVTEEPPLVRTVTIADVVMGIEEASVALPVTEEPVPAVPVPVAVGPCFPGSASGRGLQRNCRERRILTALVATLTETPASAKSNSEPHIKLETSEERLSQLTLAVVEAVDDDSVGGGVVLAVLHRAVADTEEKVHVAAQALRVVGVAAEVLGFCRACC